MPSSLCFHGLEGSSKQHVTHHPSRSAGPRSGRHLGSRPDQPGIQVIEVQHLDAEQLTCSLRRPRRSSVPKKRDHKGLLRPLSRSDILNASRLDNSVLPWLLKWRGMFGICTFVAWFILDLTSMRRISIPSVDHC